jgi:hypothetical protein
MLYDLVFETRRYGGEAVKTVKHLQQRFHFSPSPVDFGRENILAPWTVCILQNVWYMDLVV